MRPPVYQQLCDALIAGGFSVELDVHPELDERRRVIGPAAFRLYARRSDGHVIAASHWVPDTEGAARSLAANMLMIADDDVRGVVDQLQL